MSRYSYKQMVTAMTANDESFDGQFYVGVHSTGIYCLPSCKAKLPLLKNVVFYSSREEAIGAGLRGCKRCKSEKFPDVLPDWLPEVLRFMKNNRNTRLTETQLRQITGVDISTIRRYFKKHLGATPLAFHRIIRLNFARQMLDSGSSYLSAAYESGWESSSGFREAYKKHFGITPGGKIVRQKDNLQRYKKSIRGYDCRCDKQRSRLFRMAGSRGS
ncbi:MAG: methylphosphotriester-DNA--protein-cysteine methyltransferase family protein [candidate division Zixibacteria bacterium]|nr:methylphosphotriester-DNA--protein-cysteine methyltransferase family protein [candidate division Zixibacteria bacterium]